MFIQKIYLKSVFLYNFVPDFFVVTRASKSKPKDLGLFKDDFEQHNYKP